MAEVALGRQDALEHFFDRHYRVVFRVALRIVRDEGEAQDITQEVFLQFVRNLHLYNQQKGSPRNWIVAIAYHRSLDRRQYLNLRHFYDHVAIDPLANTSAARPGRLYDPPRVVAQERLDAAFVALTSPQRETIRLYCFDGLTFREIAERRGETVANTRNHYYRALERIRGHLFATQAASRSATQETS